MSKILRKIALLLLPVLFYGVATLGYFELRYPVLYCSEVRKNCERFNLDENLVYAIIWTESKFDKNALSSSGAMGLMQLIPSTAEWCAAMLNMDFSVEDLFEPKVNIKLGCYYFKYLLNSFQSVKYALAAYNAGEGNVRIWLQNGGKIAFEETCNYVKTVAHTERLYRQKLKKFI